MLATRSRALDWTRLRFRVNAITSPSQTAAATGTAARRLLSRSGALRPDDCKGDIAIVSILLDRRRSVRSLDVKDATPARQTLPRSSMASISPVPTGRILLGELEEGTCRREVTALLSGVGRADFAERRLAPRV